MKQEHWGSSLTSEEGGDLTNTTMERGHDKAVTFAEESAELDAAGLACSEPEAQTVCMPTTTDMKLTRSAEASAPQARQWPDYGLMLEIGWSSDDGWRRSSTALDARPAQRGAPACIFIGFCNCVIIS